MNWFKKKLWNTVDRLLVRRQAALLYYREPAQIEIINLIRKIKSETRMLLWDPEAYQIFALVRSLANVPGDIIEVGTYRGGSAKLIAEAEPNKDIYLFDSFEGLPEVNAAVDAARFSTGQYASSYDEVKNYLAPYPRIHIYKGFFPATAAPLAGRHFSFVHLDVDIYSSTKESLEYVYNRVAKGGVILSHDYSTAKGVRQAFTEFFADKPESVIELMSSQCLVIKQ